jgi:hypothetical protein
MGRYIDLILVSEKQKYFFGEGLTANQLDSSQEIGFLARRRQGAAGIRPVKTRRLPGI